MNLEIFILGGVGATFLILLIEISKLFYIWLKERIRYRRELEEKIIYIYESINKKRGGRK
jgi:hypothetical protein